MHQSELNDGSSFGNRVLSLYKIAQSVDLKGGAALQRKSYLVMRKQREPCWGCMLLLGRLV